MKNYKKYILLIISCIMIAVTFERLNRKGSFDTSSIGVTVFFFVFSLFICFVFKQLKLAKYVIKATAFLAYLLLVLVVCDDILWFFFAMSFVTLSIFTANIILERHSYQQINRKWKVTLAITSCLMFCLFQGVNIYGSLKISKIISQIQEKSYPLTAENVNRMYEKMIRPQENGGALLVACAEIISRSSFFNNIKIDNISIDIGYDREKELTKKDIEKIEEYMEQYKKEFAMLSEILSYPQLIIPINFTSPSWSILLPHLSRLSDVAKKIALISRYQVETGQNQLAIESIQQIFKIAHSLEKEHFIISTLAKNSIEKIGATTILHFIQNEATPKDILLLKDIILPHCNYEPFPIYSEFVLIHDVLNEIKSMSVFKRFNFFYDITGFRSFFDLPAHVYLSKGFSKVDIALVLQKLFDANEIQTAGEKAVLQELKAMNNETSSLYPISSMFDLKIEDRNLAKLTMYRCIFLAIEIKLAQLETGSYPASLDSIAVNYPTYKIDPFSGKEFIYKDNQDSYTLYSVGKNFEDNHGDVTFNYYNNEYIELYYNAKDIGIIWEK